MDQEDPFPLLVDWSSRTAKEPVLAVSANLKAGWTGVGYRIGETFMVTPLAEIREVILYPKVRKIPGARPWFKGIATCHRELLAISDIQGMLSGCLQVITSFSRVLVVPWAGQLSGFLVSHLERLQEYGSADPSTIPLQSPYRKYVQGATTYDGRYWLQLSLRQIAAGKEFNRIAEQKFLPQEEA